MAERRFVIFADHLCQSHMTKLRILLTALVAFAVLAIPAGASAKGRDSDRDGMPNRWEHKFRLKVHKNDARRDRDRDGLRNLAEFKRHTNPADADSDNDGIDDGDEVRTDHNPRDRDSDDDGVKDGDEVTGSVKSFTDGTLVIQLPDGTTVSGKVTDATEVECEDGEHGDDDSRTTASAASRGDDDEGDDDHGDDENDDHGDHSGRGDDDEHEDSCDTTALTAGAVVHEAELKLDNGSATWEEVELVR